MINKPTSDNLTHPQGVVGSLGWGECAYFGGIYIAKILGVVYFLYFIVCLFLPVLLCGLGFIAVLVPSFIFISIRIMKYLTKIDSYYANKPKGYIKQEIIKKLGMTGKILVRVGRWSTYE